MTKRVHVCYSLITMMALCGQKMKYTHNFAHISGFNVDCKNCKKEIKRYNDYYRSGIDDGDLNLGPPPVRQAQR